MFLWTLPYLRSWYFGLKNSFPAMPKPHACTVGLKFLLLKMISLLFLTIHNLHECEKDFKFSSHEMCAFETKVLEEEVGQFPLINWSRCRTNHDSTFLQRKCSVHPIYSSNFFWKAGIFQVFRILRTQNVPNYHKVVRYLSSPDMFCLK